MNPSTIQQETEEVQAVAAEILGAMMQADVSVEIGFSTVNEELGMAAAHGGYLPAVAWVARFLAGADALRNVTDQGAHTLPDSPLAFLDALKEPTVKLATYASATEPMFMLAQRLGLPIPVENPEIADGFSAIKTSLTVIAGVALRALRDGEAKGWWTITPEGFGSVSTVVAPENVDVPLVLFGGSEEEARAQIVTLAEFLETRLGSSPQVPADRASSDIVNDAIAALAPVASPEQTESPFVIGFESAADALTRLANFVLARVPGEPSQSQGVVDTVARVIRGIDAKAYVG